MRVGSCIALVLIAGSWLTGASAAAAVFGRDDRVALPERYQALRGAIGLLFNGRSRTICTAFCVGPSTIATAAHCIYRTAGEAPPRLADFRFRTAPGGRLRQTTIAGARDLSAKQSILAGSESVRVRPPIEAARDWALVRIAEPICRGHVLALRSLPRADRAASPAADKIYEVGFHRDFRAGDGAWKLAYSGGCEAPVELDGANRAALARDFLEPEALILHTCDTGGASSGSPLLVDQESGPEVVGINVGTYEQARVVMQERAVVHRYKSATIANTGVSARAFAHHVAGFQAADILPNGSGVRDIQRALAARGQYGGDLDGRFGPELRAAIEAYEGLSSLPILGLPTTALLKHLSSR